MLTGAGAHFCSGGDLGNIAGSGLDSGGWRWRLTRLHDWLKDLMRLDKPVIAAVDGAAYGAGFSLALAADFIICATGNDITLGALEPQFYALLLDTFGLADGPKTRTSQARNGTRPLGPRAGCGWRLCFWRGTRALASTAGVHRCLLWRRAQCRGDRRAPAHARAACTPSTRAVSRPCWRRASTQVLPMRPVICVPLARTRKR